MTGNNRWSAPLVTIGVALVILSSCQLTVSDERAESDRTKRVDPGSTAPIRVSPYEGELPLKDQVHWTLPTDPYFGFEAADLVTAAQVVTRYVCMHDAGFTDFPLHMDPFAPRTDTAAGDGISYVFNEHNAALYGYRLAPERGYRANILPNYEAMPAAYQQAFDSCNEKSMEFMSEVSSGELPEEPRASDVDEGRQSIESQLNRLYVARTSESLADEAAAWRECMAPLGVVDLPHVPYEVLRSEIPQSLQNRWSWAPAGEPSIDEVMVATQDAACRRSSGWFDALYEEEWNLREQFVAEHRDELAPFLAQYDAQWHKALEVLDEYGYQ